MSDFVSKYIARGFRSSDSVRFMNGRQAISIDNFQVLEAVYLDVQRSNVLKDIHGVVGLSHAKIDSTSSLLVPSLFEAGAIKKNLFAISYPKP